MNFDDVREKLSNAGTDLRFRFEDLLSSPTSRRRLIGGGVLAVLVVVFVFFALPRLLPSGSSGAREARVKEFRGDNREWIERARAAIAGDARFAGVTIEESADETGAAMIVVRGPLLSMPDRIALGAKFKDIGQPSGLVYEFGEAEAP
ncbi:MAG: hypothetical protein Kow0022_03820 [Phycisphaerales bacterium]